MAGKIEVTPAMLDSIGTESDPVTWEVEAGEIIRFAEAIGDPNPIYSDESYARNTKYGGIIAPPTFLHAYQASPLDFERPDGVGVDGGSNWEYFSHVRPGDRITVTSNVKDIFEKKGKVGNMLFIISEINYTNQFGVLVAKRESTGIYYDALQTSE